MNDAESEHLLRGKIADLDATSAELSVLSSHVGHLPLALAQCASFIQEMPITVREYTQLLSSNDRHTVYLISRDFQTDGRDPETIQAVAETWILSFQQIEKQHTWAADILACMSFLDWQGISRAFISHYIFHYAEEKQSH